MSAPKRKPNTTKKTPAKKPTPQERFAKLLREAAAKGWWSPLGGGTLSGTYDAFHGQKEPSKLDLTQAYDDIVYACVSLIAQKISRVPIRLYVRTDPGDRQPRHATRAVEQKQLRHLRKKHFGTDIKEVVEHPLLNLLNHGNDYHNKHDLLEHTQIDLDLTGNSYWHVRFNTFGIPDELHYLPSFLVHPQRDERNRISGWLFGQGEGAQTYKLKEVLHFKYANPLDPYGEGMSPLRGAWGRREISAKELSYLDNYLSNQGRPDTVISIKDSISPLEAERVAKEYYQRYQGQGNGGPIVVDGTMNLQPLNFPAKDLAELQVYQVLKTVICNCFHIPPDIFELGSSSNRSTREAAIYALAADCLKPRIEGNVQKLNDRLVPYFDTRLFFEADNVVPDDDSFELQKVQMLLSQQVVTRDEVRVKEGYTSEAWAREPLLPSGVLPATAFEEQLETPEPPASDPPVDRTQQAQAIQALQTAYYGGQLPREAALAQCTIIYGFNPQEADALLPVKPEATPPTQQQPEDQPQEVAPSPKAMPEAEQVEEASEPTLLTVPDFRQRDYYDCGAAATHAVCAYFGVGDDAEAEFIEALGTNEQGTAVPHILEYLEACGLNCYPKQDLTLDDLALSTDAGCPVICPVQSGDTGHYVVVTGIDQTNVYTQDPLAGPTASDHDTFLANWHDTGADGTEYHQFGIGVSKPTDPAKCCKAHTAAKGTLTLKSPTLLVKALKRFFRHQADAVTKTLKMLDAEVATKSDDERLTLDARHWADVMFGEIQPVIRHYFDTAAKQTASALSLSASMFDTVQPRLKEGVNQATLHFCRETNATTAKDITDALAQLRKELTEGLVEGDVKNAMMRRVQKVFENASNHRAFTIAATEASRGQHNAMMITAEESGVVTGKTWLLSDDACPLCKPLSGKTLPLDGIFVTDGTGVYAEVKTPPRHPYCRCNLLLETT